METQVIEGCFFGISARTADFKKASANIRVTDREGNELQWFRVKSTALFVACAKANGLAPTRGYNPAKDGRKESWYVYFEGRFTVTGDVDGEWITPTKVDIYNPTIDLSGDDASFFATAKLATPKATATAPQGASTL